jgi:hypothetical protein
LKLRYRYLPFNEVSAGMILGESLSISNNGFLCVSLPQGHTLTQDNLHQLEVHHAKFVLIAEQDDRSESQLAFDVALATSQVKEIFSGADTSDPGTMALYKLVLEYRCA